MNKIPKNHPRYQSLILRKKIANSYHEGVLAESGMIAHGRGEAFDYLLGELTSKSAKNAIKVAAAALLLAKHPVISVNGNTAVLGAPLIVELGSLVPALIEINLFYRTPERVEKINRILKESGAGQVLGLEDEPYVPLPGLKGPRSRASANGVARADVVFVPLEDGDRAQALVNNNKTVITIDLNPLSRTARKSSITIVDNLTRALPLLIREVKKLKDHNHTNLEKMITNFNNLENLNESLKTILESYAGAVKK